MADNGLTADDEAWLQIVEDNTQYVLQTFPTAINKALEMIGQLAEGYAKRLTPVVTGRLRNSITHTIDNSGSVYIGTNVKYAIYVEEGSCKKHGGQPHRMLHHAASDHTNTYKKVIADCLKNA